MHQNAYHRIISAPQLAQAFAQASMPLPQKMTKENKLTIQAGLSDLAVRIDLVALSCIEVPTFAEMPTVTQAFAQTSMPLPQKMPKKNKLTIRAGISDLAVRTT
ncbi:hypothetical protein F8M41_026409 [Gigaspora margarita]|uniref:Uncharacterized protein n=1 Tax=Gigaspora margarita TaxID=4874 RepID=A0A8H3XIJ5_GIGMA|nr:hypothetical protein F8M41_026409 [Gigaspora margarita]